MLQISHQLGNGFIFPDSLCRLSGRPARGCIDAYISKPTFYFLSHRLAALTVFRSSLGGVL